MATAYLHMPPLRGEGGAFERLERTDAEEIARRGAATLEGVTDVQTEVPYGSSLGEALHRVAKTEHADLLADGDVHTRGSPGTSLAASPSRSSTTAPAPWRSSRSPTVSRASAASASPSTVRPVRVRRSSSHTGSSKGRRAGRRKLELLHVSPAPPHIPQPGLTRPAPEHALDREPLEEMAAEAAAYGEVDVVEATGDPAHELVRMSEGLDVLVTGSRDQGAVRRLLLGSVSTHAVRHAVCPVIVVPVRAADRGETTAAEHTTA